MASRNNLVNNLWQKVQQDSASWGSLVLWVFALVILLMIMTMYANTIEIPT
ncbi:hypothetical protein [Iningainema tapete]|uniref:Uncharacterized protein n=1 Tax=Iningainema tapete BLCC-T55 TaxID=2748662 RepID=A0A8J6XS55_9CYAN|nr:hypothetical protein [Iningainema tapete]MBD2777334.1 hypothetical protein [Iningainema tapete BLCC-T55]